MKRKYLALKEDNREKGATESFKKVCASGENSMSNLNKCATTNSSFLSNEELINIERFCQRWREESQSDSVTGKSFELSSCDEPIYDLEDCQLREYLLRCGDLLTSLFIPSWAVKSPTEETLKVIGEHCKKLLHLCVPCVEVRNEFPPEFLAAVRNLKSLQMTNSRGLKDHILAPLLISAKNLQELVISRAEIEGSSLVHLNRDCKRLDLSYCSSLLPENLIKDLTKLEVLKLGTEHAFDPKILEPCSGHLRTLNLDVPEFEMEDDSCWPLFPNLQSLTLRCRKYFKEWLFLLIRERCPYVQLLDISGQLGSQKVHFSEHLEIIRLVVRQDGGIRVDERTVKVRESWGTREGLSYLFGKRIVPNIRVTDSLNRKVFNREDKVEISISNLNNDCLAHIFSFLNQRQLVGIERVCKKWTDVSQRCWSGKRSLDLSVFTEDEMIDYLEFRHIQQILSKCGKYLHSLKCHEIKSFDYKETLSVIGELCQNLEHLSITYFKLKKGFPSEFLNAIKNLKSLSLLGSRELATDNDQLTTDNDQLTSLLLAAKNLETLAISEININISSLIHVNKNCKHLDLTGCSSISTEDLNLIVQDLGNLEVLKLYGTRIWLHPLTLRPCCKSLKELHLPPNVVSTGNRDLWPVFPNLKILSLKGCKSEFDVTLTMLVEHCPNLEELDISGTFYSDNEIKELVNLTKLRCLKMNNCKISNESLRFLAHDLNSQLASIECDGCESISNYDLQMLVVRCPNLIELKVPSAAGRRLIQMILERVMRAPRKIPFNLCMSPHVGGIEREYIEKDRLLLKVLM